MQDIATPGLIYIYIYIHTHTHTHTHTHIYTHIYTHTQNNSLAKIVAIIFDFFFKTLKAIGKNDGPVTHFHSKKKVDESNIHISQKIIIEKDKQNAAIKLVS